MKAEIIAVGTELLLGQIVNTDAQIISSRLSSLGIDVFYHTAVGDNSARLAAALKAALSRSDLVITTGGLGPTMDDLTKETVAEVLGLDMVLNAAEMAKLEQRFAGRGSPMPPNNRKQAMIPDGARVVPNHNGTAPGVIVEKDQKIIVVLPGPPRELLPMLEETVLPYLADKAGAGTVIKSRVLKLCGIGESAVEEEIKDILREQSNPTLATLAGAEMTLRITAKAKDENAAVAMIAGAERKVRQRLGDYIYGADDDTLESAVGGLLREKQLTLALAESCTGGAIANRITNIPGSSDYFITSIVSYSNDAKTKFLNVPAAILATHGAVSRETAEGMAVGVRRLSGASVALAVTGIAGPGGATATKPVGLVYVALAGPDILRTEEHVFGTSRLTFKRRVSQQALMLLWRYLKE
jgi:nicotinamide-nucleotide amidase